MERLAGDAGRLHGCPVPDPPARAVWLCEAHRPALVLGSTQAEGMVDLGRARADGFDVVRRRSGGGAVAVTPGDTVWVDVVLPAGDRLWDDDVGRSALWLGEAWRTALGTLGLTGAQVHRGPLACGPLGRRVCFGAVAPGEVVTHDGRKLVGISQRRTRRAARFQSVLYRAWDPAPLVRLLRLDAAAAAALADAAAGTGVDAGPVVDAFLRQLPA